MSMTNLPCTFITFVTLLKKTGSTNDTLLGSLGIALRRELCKRITYIWFYLHTAITDSIMGYSIPLELDRNLFPFHTYKFDKNDFLLTFFRISFKKIKFLIKTKQLTINELFCDQLY